MRNARSAVKRPHIVVIGGGTGLSVMLRGLKEKPLHITAIVTVGDDGGSSGRLRAEMHMPPPGDIRNVLIALADVEPMLSKMLQHRFTSGNGLAGHSLGNLILAAMHEITGDFVTGVKELSKVLAVRGQVLPTTDQAIVLKAEMHDGRIVEGESSISQAGGKIKRIFIDTDNVRPLPEAIAAIERADAIIMGPGSLYTSIIPNLLVPQVSEAVIRTDAVKIFVANVMTQPGETDGYKASDHLKAIYQHIGHDALFDYVIANNGAIPEEVIASYAEQGSEPVCVDEEELLACGCRVIADTLYWHRTYLRHDSVKLSDHIYRLVAERLSGKR